MASKSVKLFVGNVPWTVCHKELREYFSRFGRVMSSQVAFDKNTGFNRGFGFVVVDQTCYEKIRNTKTHLLEGSYLNPRPANQNNFA